MSPVIRAATATIAGLLTTIPILSGGRDGPAVTDFTDVGANILSPLVGPKKVGVFNISLYDPSRRHFPLCDVSNVMPTVECDQDREITTSVFYPACPSLADQERPVLLNEQHFAPVFPAPVLANISHDLGRGSQALHNLMSQATANGPSCQGQYPVVIFAPSAGGQRQAYTQAASDLASMGYVVVTVDHTFISSAVESHRDRTVQVGTFGDWIHTDEALRTQSKDLSFVHRHLVSKDQPLSREKSWAGRTSVELDACIFGHGTGGQVARKMVDAHEVKCGGSLEGILTLPAPFNREKWAFDGVVCNSTFGCIPWPDPPSQTSPLDPPPPSRDTSKHSSLHLAPLIIGGMNQAVDKFNDFVIRIIDTVFCHLHGNCTAQDSANSLPFQKRSVDDDPWYYPKKPYHKDPYYDDDKYDDDDYYDDDYDDDYEDDYDYYDDPYDHYDPYDPCDRYKRPYKPSKPFPPPGIFPPNMTWPPYNG